MSIIITTLVQYLVKTTRFEMKSTRIVLLQQLCCVNSTALLLSIDL